MSEGKYFDSDPEDSQMQKEALDIAVKKGDVHSDLDEIQKLRLERFEIDVQYDPEGLVREVLERLPAYMQERAQQLSSRFYKLSEEINQLSSQYPDNPEKVTANETSLYQEQENVRRQFRELLQDYFVSETDKVKKKNLRNIGLLAVSEAHDDQLNMNIELVMQKLLDNKRDVYQNIQSSLN